MPQFHLISHLVRGFGTPDTRKSDPVERKVPLCWRLFFRCKWWRRWRRWRLPRNNQHRVLNLQSPDLRAFTTCVSVCVRVLMWVGLNVLAKLEHEKGGPQPAMSRICFDEGRAANVKIARCCRRGSISLVLTRTLLSSSPREKNAFDGEIWENWQSWSDGWKIIPIYQGTLGKPKIGWVFPCDSCSNVRCCSIFTPPSGFQL